MKKEKKESPDKGRKDKVEVKFKNIPFNVHRGNQKVSELKKIFGVNPGYVLVQIIDGELVDLPNDDSVVIKGEEEFNCQPPVGDNS